jgi:hypothetical protein
VRRWLALAAAPAVVLAAVAALSAGAAPTAAPAECKGLQRCVPVAGPWVVVPGRLALPRQQASFQLSCPRGYVVGGLAAQVSDRAVDIQFLGSLGSPVTPGITTSRTALFLAAYVGARGSSPTFRPRIGCMPASGGGGRVQTARILPAAKPTVRRATTVRVQPGAQLVIRGCPRGERLVSGWHAIGFRTAKPPDPELVGAVSASQAFRAGRVTVLARGTTAVRSVPAVVQAGALCSRVK